MQTEPAITVLMPAYNAGKTIQEAIHSVVEQSFGNFELLIIDDGSTDDTEEQVKKITDPRIRFIKKQHGGIAAALNLGLRESHSPFIARFDADDICYPDRLKLQYDFLTSNPDYIICGGCADYMDENGEFVFTYHPPAFTDGEIQDLDRFICPFIHSGVMFVKDKITMAGGYNEHAFSFQDHLLWQKVLKLGKACNLDKALIKVRLSPRSVSMDERWRPKRFLEIKRNAIIKGSITEEEGRELKQIMDALQHQPRKQAAYHSLLAKKYLWDNYQPGLARKQLKKAIGIKPFGINNYCFYVLSFFPKKMIRMTYSILANR